MKRNGETVEYQVTLNIPHLRGKNQQNLRESPCFLREWSSSDRSWLSQRTCLSLCGGSRETGLPSQSRSARQLPQRGSHWQAGPLPTGRLSPDMAQKGGPCYRGQRLLDKRTLSSCRESWQRSTTVPEKIRLCSSRVGLTGTPGALPLGELSPKVTERARTPTKSFSAPFCSKNFLKIQFIGLLFCYTPVRTKRHRREEE